MHTETMNPKRLRISKSGVCELKSSWYPASTVKGSTHATPKMSEYLISKQCSYYTLIYSRSGVVIESSSNSTYIDVLGGMRPGKPFAPYAKSAGMVHRARSPTLNWNSRQHPTNDNKDASSFENRVERTQSILLSMIMNSMNIDGGCIKEMALWSKMFDD